jgi:predicted amidophosphoribosyltransferase
MLDCSVALDYNFAERGRYTELGLAEYNAKNAQHKASIEMLTKACIRAISEIRFYRESDVICAVPPSPEKEWDLPMEIARLVSAKTGKPDISASVQFRAVKKSIKATSLEEKWATLSDGLLSVDELVKGKKVVLIDDKYQSGTTAQFVASKLYDAGAEEVNGLFCIKTWRDTDNQ